MTYEQTEQTKLNKSSSGVKYADGDSNENTVSWLFDAAKVMRGSSSESNISVVVAPEDTCNMKRLSL